MSDNRRSRNRKIVENCKKNTVCLICRSHKNLTFHHREPICKKFEISEAATLKVSLDSLRSELDKCDILCAHCHFFLHDRFGLERYNDWRRQIISDSKFRREWQQLKRKVFIEKVKLGGNHGQTRN